jgi:predicted O-methyltransferase YrrM
MIGDTTAAVDIDRFAHELPELFDDFPRSERPRGRRFDDVVDSVPNLAEENNLALVNLAASLLEPGESYVEAGTYMGASLIAAMRGNEGGDFVAMDYFSFGPTEVKGRALPEASREALEASLERFGAQGATILEGDTLELLRGGALEGRRVGVFYYDASHAYEDTVGALRAVEPYLAPQALLIVDDYDWDEVERATRDYVESQPDARMLLEIGGERKGLPQWWEGVAVVARRAP